MLISKAYAAAIATDTATTTTATTTGTTAGAPAAPSATEVFLWNMGLIGLLVVMFYVLMILPQQRRFKEHSKMLSELKKGDKIITSGGLVGTIDKMVDDYEAVVDLGNNMKVTVLRSSLQRKSDPVLKKKAANDKK